MYNYNFSENDWYKNISRNTNQTNMMPSLFTPEEGYNKGNLFANLYSQYKNYKPAVLTASNEKDRLFLNYAQNAFAAHELNLYLDLHPNDTSMITLFNDYREKADQLMKEYESKYGPLNISSNSLNQTPFVWEQETWPWEGGM